MPGRSSPDLSRGQPAAGDRSGAAFPRMGRRDNPYAAQPGRRLVIEWAAQL